MRQIKFRGKAIQGGQWVYGCLVNNLWTYNSDSDFVAGSPVCEIITGKYEGDCWEDVAHSEDAIVDVFPDSVGQYTGLKDKNGKEIYEGDILLDLFTKNAYEVKFGFCRRHAYRGWYCEDTDNYQTTLNADYDGDINHAIEVIGNIYENPDLLK